MTGLLDRIPDNFDALLGKIMALKHLNSLSDNMAHLNAGLAIWVIAIVILRRPAGDIRPLLVVALAEITNEILDYLYHGYRNDTWMDIFSTLAWPLAITLALRMGARSGKKRL